MKTDMLEDRAEHQRPRVLKAAWRDRPPGLDEFREAFRLHPSGVAVITGSVNGLPVAMTVSSLISVSAEPPFVIFSLSKQSYATQQLMQTDSVIAHLLNSDYKWLAELGARGNADRFEDRNLWHTIPSGEPVYRGVPAWLRLSVVDRTEVGSAIVCIAQVLHIELSLDEGEQSPLVYHSRNWHRLTEASVIDETTGRNVRG
ncbi:MAG: flavin reductase [Leucobacter sp.]|nr:flavin reductase [Leucobacter sp.]